MQVPKHPAHLRETASEYVLSINKDDREFAKAIAGRRWDGTRVSWIYPRSAQVYEEIRAAFAEKLVDHTTGGQESVQVVGPGTTLPVGSRALPASTSSQLTRPATSGASAPPARMVPAPAYSSSAGQTEAVQDLASSVAELAKRVAELNAENARLRKQVEEQETGTELAELRGTIAAHERRISELNRRLESSEKERHGLLSKNGRLDSIVSDLKLSLSTLKEQEFEPYVLDLAVNLSGGNKAFRQVIKHKSISSDLALDVHKEMLRRIKGMLKSRTSDLKSDEILRAAATEEVLSRDALELAHIIRKQRNTIAHSHLSSGQREASVLIVLFSAARLWGVLEPKNEMD